MKINAISSNKEEGGAIQHVCTMSRDKVQCVCGQNNIIIYLKENSMSYVGQYHHPSL